MTDDRLARVCAEDSLASVSGKGKGKGKDSEPG
ncbi:hypothetical protein LMG28690_06366 [Paraburkholderia caffeinilytica]|nr:hypothetical protein LMG28690_06366 [Paraburkholderia caffeinilytica]